ncbi:MAG: ATP-binding cassette domain-containing protein [Acidimicrobiales bacterium]
MRLGGSRSPLPWLGALLLVYLGGPVLYFLYRLASTPARGFHDPGLYSAFWVSVQGATIAIAVVTLLGVPLGYLLARHKGPLVAALGALVMVPLAVPPLMSGILLVYVVGPYTPIGQFFANDLGVHLTESLVGVVLAQSFVCAPFLVVSAWAAFSAVDPTLGEVAATLGHGHVGRFLGVEVPAAAAGIRAGMALAWLRAFGEFGATVVLAYHPSSLNVYTYIQFSSTGVPGTLAPTALALGVAVVAAAASRLVVLRVRRRVHGVAAALPVPRRPAPPVPSPLRFDVHWRLGEFKLSVAHRAESLRLAVLGPSGSGKSALLRCLAGLYGPGPGPVEYGGRRVDSVPVERRRIGYVAQGFSLFPHLSVWEQVLFGCGADPSIAAYWLEALRLQGLERRLPSELSGGQRQRVAMAQALARSPDVLFLDEPLTALDAPVRVELRRELRRLQRDAGISTVLVTHDPEEAALLADEVIVVADGRVLQQGAAAELYDRPRSPAVAELLGVPNVAAASITDDGRLRCAGGVLLEASTGDVAPGARVLWRVPPADVEVSAPAAHHGSRAGAMVGRVDDVSWLGTRVEVRVALASGLVLEANAPDVGVVVGSPVHVRIDPRAVRVWAAKGPTVEPGVPGKVDVSGEAGGEA